ncbi:MAG: hypothetical protein MH825_05365 [Cyanobacteria bacterium]|nr:hypothetical protein [Cyanobacteriota bacterium]
MTLPFLPSVLGRGLPVAIAVASLGGAVAIAPPSALAQSNTDQYPPNFEEDFTEGCLLNAIRAGGLSPDMAEDYCGCTVTTLQSRYSFQQAIALYEQVRQSTNGQLPEPLDAIANTCLNQAVDNHNARSGN